MNPSFIEKDQILLMGLSFFGDPFQKSGGWSEDNEIGMLWKRLMHFLYGVDDLKDHYSKNRSFFELHIETDETIQKGYYDVFVGTEVPNIQMAPLELLVKVLPPSLYAVFTMTGNDITTDWHKSIFQEWMPESGYKKAYPYVFQYYDERFKGIDRIEESVMDVYIPVTKIA